MLVFTNSARRPWTRQSFNLHWRRARAAAGRPDDGLHQLRHTFATSLLANGVNVAAVARYLGHASPTITLRFYSHWMPSDDDRARAIVDAVLSPTGDAAAVAPVWTHGASDR